MGPLFLFACMPHIVDTAKFGRFDAQSALELPADSGEQSEAVTRAYVAPQARMKFTFRMKVSDGEAQLTFSIEEGAGRKWSLIAASTGTTRIPIPRHPLTPTQTAITIPSATIPSLTLDCTLTHVKSQSDAAIEKDPLQKQIAAPTTDGAVKKRNASDDTPDAE